MKIAFSLKKATTPSSVAANTTFSSAPPVISINADNTKLSGFTQNIQTSSTTNLKKSTASVFLNDDDEDDTNGTIYGSGMDATRAAILREQAIQAAQVEAMYATSAMSNDGLNAYDYDGWQSQREETEAKRKESKNTSTNGLAPPPPPTSRYIGTLLQQAEKRAQQRELVKERIIAKKNAEEEEELGTTEKFITSAYREKLKERQKLQELEAKEEAMENADSVTKKANFAGFYASVLDGVHGNVVRGNESITSSDTKMNLSDNDTLGIIDPVAKRRRLENEHEESSTSSLQVQSLDKREMEKNNMIEKEIVFMKDTISSDVDVKIKENLEEKVKEKADAEAAAIAKAAALEAAKAAALERAAARRRLATQASSQS